MFRNALTQPRMAMALLVAIMISTGQGSGARAESSRSRLARLEECQKLDNPRKSPGCREFFESEPSGTPVSTVEFCESNTRPCVCSDNGVDVRCTFRICGYAKGFYRDSNLTLFAEQISSELSSWGSKSVIFTKFIGFADGTKWGTEKKPKPQPLSQTLVRCLSRARKENESTMRDLLGVDLLDAELALLRGCSLEDALRQIIENFEFDSTPAFSFDARRGGVSDSNIRAAELEVVIADACRRLAQ